jgi:hypothetical protein
MDSVTGDILRSLPEEAHDLGELRSVNPFSRFVAIACWVVGILGLLVAPTVPILFILAPPRAGSPIGWPVVLAFAGFFGVCGVVLIGAALYYRGLRYLVFEGGLVRVHGRQSEVVRWREVTAYWDLIMAIRLDTEAGRSVKMSVRYLADPAALKNDVENRVTARLLPGALQRFAAGESLPFGPFAVSRDGIEYKGTQLGWVDIKGFQLIVMMKAKTKHVRITQAGKVLPFCHVDTRRVPNLRIFLTLVHQGRPDLV